MTASDEPVAEGEKKQRRSVARRASRMVSNIISNDDPTDSDKTSDFGPASSTRRAMEGEANRLTGLKLFFPDSMPRSVPLNREHYDELCKEEGDKAQANKRRMTRRVSVQATIDAEMEAEKQAGQMAQTAAVKA